MKKLLPLLFIGFLTSLSAQKTILVYDVFSQSLDSISAISFDPSAVSEQTMHAIGNYNDDVEVLQQTAPSENIFPEANYTMKVPAAFDLDLTSYPIRTSVNMFSIYNGEMNDVCSGSMISKRHVLTSAHCITDINSNIVKYDSMLVSPSYNFGAINSEFGTSLVSKLYFFRDWKVSGEDFAILELEENLGAQTGWIGIGYNEEDDDLKDGIFYKFSYPNKSIFALDSNIYNGDTMYYGYGEIDVFSERNIGVESAFGIPGESGSSLIKVVNNEVYTTYGVFNFSNNLNHCRIVDWQFHAFKDIIAGDLILTTGNPLSNQDLVVYPNPSADRVFLKNSERYDIQSISLYDNSGKSIRAIDVATLANGIDMSQMPDGIYYLNIKQESNTTNLQLVISK